MPKKKKHFYLIRCWFIFFSLIDKVFCPVREFVFCNKLDNKKPELWRQSSLTCKRSQISFDINVINLFLVHFPFPSLRHSIIFLLFKCDGWWREKNSYITLLFAHCLLLMKSCKSKFLFSRFCQWKKEMYIEYNDEI